MKKKEEKRDIDEDVIKETPMERLARLKELYPNRSDKYYVIFVTKEGESFRVQKKKRIKPPNSEINSKLGKHFIDTSKHAFRKKQKYFIFLCLDSNQQLSFLTFGCDVTIPPDITRDVVDKSVFKQLNYPFNKIRMGNIILYIVLALFGGGCFGFILREMLMSM